MKTRDSTPSPQPVHVHVPETTHVHVHMKRSPVKTPKLRPKDAAGKTEGATPKVRSPWLPPGRVRTSNMGSYMGQGTKGKPLLERGRGVDGQEEEEPRVNLTLLLQEQDDNRRAKRPVSNKDQVKDSDELLRALVEAEIDGVAVANQLTTLRETITSLAKDKRLSKFHAASVGRQQGLLFDKIDIFDHTNQKLREMLREWSQAERESIVLFEERDALQTRLSKSEAEKTELLAKLGSKEKEVSKLTQHLGFEQECMRTTQGLSKVLESTRDELEIQLNKAEADKIRMGALIQRMQQRQEQQQQLLHSLQKELEPQTQGEAVEQAKQDQQALKLLTQRAEVAELSVKELTARLQERESKLAQAVSTSSDWCQRLSQEALTKEQLEREVSDLKVRVSDLQSQLQSAGERRRVEHDALREQLQNLTSDITAVKLENQRLQVEMRSTEEKFKGLYSDARELKTSLKKNENLVDKYKKKVQRARLESDDSRQRMESTQREMQEAKIHLEHEKEQQRRELLGRLVELEVLPDRLRRTEQELRDAQQDANVHENKHLEHSAALADVRHQVEQQGALLEMHQQKNQLLQDENNVLKEKIHNLEIRLEDMKVDNTEMCHALSSKDMGLQCIQQQLDDKNHECNLLSKQLQLTLNDSQRQVGDGLHNVIVKERMSQSKALDLENQLSRAKTDLSQLQRSKDEMERRYHSQLLNLKDRLEHSDFTNQTLHNYVHFLKNSYGNSLGDSMQTNWLQNSRLNS